MNNKDLEIKEYSGEGYMPMVDFGEWRVALANFKPEWEEGKLTFIERHMETDEVFVLLSGTAKLYIGEEMKEYSLENGKLYNVKQGVWHQLSMSTDAKMLIVENLNTTTENSEYKKI